MGEFIEARRRITVQSSSDDRLVRVEQSRQSGISVIIHPDIQYEYTDDSIAEQIEECILDALRLYRKEISNLLERHDRSIQQDPPESEQYIHNQLHQEQMVDYEAKSISPRGIAQTILHGDGDISISLINNPLKRIDVSHEVLTNEINTSIQDAGKAYNKHAITLWRSIANNST